MTVFATVKSDKEDTVKFQRDIDLLENWARKWGM